MAADNNALVFPEALERYRGRLLVACSGGADSTCLAHGVMQRALAEGSGPPHLVYVHHGLRPEADEEAEAVVALAESFGSEAHVRRVHLQDGASIEAEARRVRYQALDLLADELQADWVLLGHTASDQAETIFMRILRGTGIVGLAGMPAERKPYARPLLAWTRRDTESYCQRHALDFVEDPMNRQQRFTRARIRHHWLPALREENPLIDEALCRLSASARDHRQVLDWASEAALAAMLEPDGLRVDGPFASLPESLAIQVLTRHAKSHGVTGLEASHLRAMLQLARDPTRGSRSLSLPGATLCRSYDHLHYRGGRAAPARVVANGYEQLPGYHERVWQPGDRMRPARLKGRSKKLSDLYGHAKLPPCERAVAKVVVRLEDAEIVWAQHIGHAFGEKIHLPVKRE